MKKVFFTIFFWVIAFTNYAEVWDNHWESAMLLSNEDKFEEAEKEINLAIQTSPIEQTSLFLARAEIECMLGQFDKALVDLNRAMELADNSGDKINILSRRSTVYANLGLESECFNDIDELKKIYPFVPKTFYYDDKIVIKNVPDCQIFKDVVRNVYKNDEVNFLPSGICIIKKKSKCECECPSCERKIMQTQTLENCKYWCDKVALASTVWCGKIFKSSTTCNVACCLVVDWLKDGCYWCCRNGNFYRDCVKPFDSVGSYLDTSKCDPFFD